MFLCHIEIIPDSSLLFCSSMATFLQWNRYSLHLFCKLGSIKLCRQTWQLFKLTSVHFQRETITVEITTLYMLSNLVTIQMHPYLSSSPPVSVCSSSLQLHSILPHTKLQDITCPTPVALLFQTIRCSLMEDLFFECLSFLGTQSIHNFTGISALILSVAFRPSTSSGPCSLMLASPPL